MAGSHGGKGTAVVAVDKLLAAGFIKSRRATQIL